MTELGAIFAELGISQYHDVFVEQGFDTWDTILDITESDFDALGVKLGHRRKLQRRIANSKNALAEQSRRASTDDRHSEDPYSGGRSDGREGVQTTGKRKYRRHPKSDENAPERPPSAYVIFSNKMREDLKGRHLTFTEIAKLVGEHWQNLSPDEKEPYEAKALAAKEKYNNEMMAYKKTESYKEYANYLAEFKAKQASQQQSKLPQPPSADASKRPKLDTNNSTASNSTTSSTGGTSESHRRDNGSTNAPNAWATITTSMAPTPTASATAPAPGAATAIASRSGRSGLGASTMAQDGTHTSPVPISAAMIAPIVAPVPTAAPTAFAAATYSVPIQSAQPLSWTDGNSRDMESPRAQSHQLPSISNLPDVGSRSSTSSTDPTTYPTLSRRADPHRKSLSFVPSLPSEATTGSVSSFAPSLRSETTSGSMSSVNSKYPSLSSEPSSAGSGAVYPPHVPLEPSLDRSLSVSTSAERNRNIPSLFSAKPPSMYESQLPPLTLPPMSPSNVNHSHQSPTDYSSTLQPLRAYSLSSSRSPPFGHQFESGPHEPPPQPMETNPLDPFSALLKAGEIVDRNSKRPASSEE